MPHLQQWSLQQILSPYGTLWRHRACPFTSSSRFTATDVKFPDSRKVCTHLAKLVFSSRRRFMSWNSLPYSAQTSIPSNDIADIWAPSNISTYVVKKIQSDTIHTTRHPRHLPTPRRPGPSCFVDIPARPWSRRRESSTSKPLPRPFWLRKPAGKFF